MSGEPRSHFVPSAPPTINKKIEEFSSSLDELLNPETGADATAFQEHVAQVRKDEFRTLMVIIDELDRDLSKPLVPFDVYLALQAEATEKIRTFWNNCVNTVGSRDLGGYNPGLLIEKLLIPLRSYVSAPERSVLKAAFSTQNFDPTSPVSSPAPGSAVLASGGVSSSPAAEVPKEFEFATYFAMDTKSTINSLIGIGRGVIDKLEKRHSPAPAEGPKLNLVLLAAVKKSILNRMEIYLKQPDVGLAEVLSLYDRVEPIMSHHRLPGASGLTESTKKMLDLIKPKIMDLIRPSQSLIDQSNVLKVIKILNTHTGSGLSFGETKSMRELRTLMSGLNELLKTVAAPAPAAAASTSSPLLNELLKTVAAPAPAAAASTSSPFADSKRLGEGLELKNMSKPTPPPDPAPGK